MLLCVPLDRFNLLPLINLHGPECLILLLFFHGGSLFGLLYLIIGFKLLVELFLLSIVFVLKTLDGIVDSLLGHGLDFGFIVVFLHSVNAILEMLVA